ncbi:WD repeat-containing protein 76-like [Penaeus indicus]|uniref:WD repeat-containing protein 76-like n=1 Tax=Penaeus indicus TaxID=29960 RepID=UPI00300D62DA
MPTVRSSASTKRNKRLLEDISNTVEVSKAANMKKPSLKKNLMLSEEEDEISEPVSKRSRTARSSSGPKKKVDIKKEELSDEEPEAKPVRRTKRAAILKMKEEPATDDDDEEEEEEEEDDDDEDGENSYTVKEKKNVKPQEKDVKVKQELESEDEKETPSMKLSDYELMIQKNIEERQKFLASLKIFEAREELEELAPQPVAKKATNRGITRIKEAPQPTERRRSLRQQKMTPDGADLQLPSEKEIAKGLAESAEKGNPRPPPGPGPVMDYFNAPGKEEFEEFLKDVHSINVAGGEKGVWSQDSPSVIKTLKKMKITESLVAKVVPSRTFSVQIHPTLDKTLVMIGGKYGELGLWDVHREDSSNGAHFFNPHSRPINCLTVDPWNYQNVYTTSYDGSLRRTDLTSGIVQQVYSYVEEEAYNVYTSWHAHRDENTMLVGGSLGDLVQIDVRDCNSNPVEYKVHNGKTVKLVTVHPTQSHYVATSSRDGCVSLWDLRKIKKNTPIAECPHGRNVSGLEFSPVTGNTLISTCSDNYLRFISCDLSDLKVQKKIHHNNQTGRWLTTFKARFLPGREDLIVVGSMMQPRRIEVWSNDGQLAHEFKGEDFASVASINAFHPTQAVLAGCNSSGRVHVFM